MAGKRRADQSLIDAHRSSLKSQRLVHSDIELSAFVSASTDSVPNHTRLWRRAFIDKLGIGARRKESPESLIKEWSLSVLPEECLQEICTMLPKVATCFRNVDFDSLEEIREAVMCDGLPTDLMKLVKFDTDFRYPGSQGAST